MRVTSLTLLYYQKCWVSGPIPGRPPRCARSRTAAFTPCHYPHLSMGDPESQRDFAPKPRVGAARLPWECSPPQQFNPNGNGVAASAGLGVPEGATPLGLKPSCIRFP